jgi:drug/metabolite transporter (DMT)-like permease
MKVILYTFLALLAFAGNSVLCRLALGENVIDAASFTSIRLLSGALVLGLILKVVQPKTEVASKGSWFASLMLFIYAVTFSYAYIYLDTGIGALILFASVQMTIIMIGMYSGNKLYLVEWLGVIVSFFGFVYLISPELTSPSFFGFILMCIAGVAWGFYTLAGKNSDNPLSDTTYNFIRSIPLVLILMGLTIQNMNLSQEGILLAILSGGITSGIGYTLWYIALGGLSAIQAAVVQLLVPVMAAIGGVLFADEYFSVRLVISSGIILGGILIIVIGKNYHEQNISIKRN